MKIPLIGLFGRMRLAISTLVVFVLCATTASLVFAEAKSISPCTLGAPTATGQTVLQFGNYEAKTDNNSSGCEWLYVRERKWLLSTFIAEDYKDNGGGPATTGWAKIAATVNNTFVSRNSVKDYTGGVFGPTIIVYTSMNGSYSTGNWFCTGTAGGSAGCAPSP